MAEVETLKVLKELLVWTRVGFYADVKATLRDVINTEKKKLSYQMADGIKSGESIRVELTMSPNDLSDFFKQCTRLGLMEQLEDGKRRRLFDLKDFGLLSSTLGGK